MAVARAEGLAWLSSLARFGMKPGLDRVRRVLDKLGHPEQSLPFLHVAGTNGKGSVCAFLTSILSTEMTVGTFTSPAFSGYRGRFVAGGQSPDDDALTRLVDEVRIVCEMTVPDDPLTEFEVLTVMAILHFARQRVDVVVWETGLGGRYDSTNVVTPVVTAITNVGRDHMEILGDTLRKVAYDKAGIIKPHVPVVTAVTDEAALVVAEVAREQGAPVYRFGADFSFVRTSYDATGQFVFYRGIHRDIGGLRVPLIGAHQCENAAIAIAVYEAARAAGMPLSLSDEALAAAVARTVWPCRFEVFHPTGQPVILDGAHNPEGAARLSVALGEWSEVAGYEADDWTLVIGVLNDKDVRPMLAVLLERAGRVIVTAPSTARATKAVDLAKFVETCRPDLEIETTDRVPEALQRALAIGKPVCCCGSLYTVHEARDLLIASSVND